MKNSRFFLISLITILFFGCATKIENVTVKPEAVQSTNIIALEELIKRYRHYWHYFSKNDWEKTYEYELPYQKFFFPYSRYLRFYSTAKKGFKVTLLKIKKKNDDIVYIKSRYQDKKTSYRFDDKWVRVNGVWYHKFYNSTFPVVEY